MAGIRYFRVKADALVWKKGAIIGAATVDPYYKAINNAWNSTNGKVEDMKVARSIVENQKDESVLVEIFEVKGEFKEASAYRAFIDKNFS